MQAHGTSYKLRELHASSWTWMLAYVIACKLMDLHASLWTCMQTHGSACILEHSQTFWNGTVMYTVVHFQLVHIQMDGQTERQKDKH